jgi:hypothetical protein
MTWNLVEAPKEEYIYVFECAYKVQLGLYVNVSDNRELA